MTIRLALALALLAAAAPAKAAFDPTVFFLGRTRGEGVLKVALRAPQKIRVDSVGQAGKDGSLTLRQVIHEPGKPPRTRHWRLRQAAPGQFTGTLSDAAGPVRIELTGDRLRIRYKSKDHLDFDMVLTPINSRQVANKTKVKRLGIIVARIDEVIRKLD